MLQFVALTIVASNTDLDGPVVNKEAIQLLESFASAVRFVESDIGDAATNRVGAINEVDSLDGSNGLDKIFLARERVSLSVVGNPISIISASPSPILHDNWPQTAKQEVALKHDRRELRRLTNE